MPLKSTTEKRKVDQRREMKMSGKQALVLSENTEKMKVCHFCRGAVDGENPGVAAINSIGLWQWPKGKG